MALRMLSGALGILSLASLVYGDCAIPPQQTIDWSKLTGKWYEQTVFDLEEKHCTIINGIDPTRYGANIWLTTIQPSGESVDTLAISISSGKAPSQEVYVPYHPAKGKDSVRLQEEPSGQEAPIIADAAQIGLIGHYTDYKILIAFKCGPKGERLAWVFSRNSQPTAEDIMNTRKLLVEIGHGWEKVLLEFSTCLGLGEK